MILLPDRGLALSAERLARNDPSLAPARDALLEEAQAALELRPPSVMDKTHLPPSGDRHDYMSLAPYWWPDPDRPDGLPYVRRDGWRNPATVSYDVGPLQSMGQAVLTLALAWRLTGNDQYTEKARQMLDVWFVDPATRMNPHLRYAQHIPGSSEGRCYGLIEMHHVVPAVVDALDLLPDADDAVRRWLADYLDWLTTSDLGIQESQTQNNHAVAWDKQVTTLALAVGRRDLAMEIVAQLPGRRYATQIEPDGSMPKELARTRSWSYTVMNLTLLCDMADLGRHVGVDLYHAEVEGRGLRRAIDFWLAEGGMGGWPHEQVVPIDRSAAASLLRRAGMVYGDEAYERHLQAVPGIERHRVNLLHPLP